MKFNVIERVMLSSILPKEGNFTNLKLVREINEQLSFDEEENKTLNFRQDGDQMRWNPVEIIKDIELGSVATALIVKELTRMDKEEKLTIEHYSLCEKFLD